MPKEKEKSKRAREEQRRKRRELVKQGGRGAASCHGLCFLHGSSRIESIDKDTKLYDLVMSP